jgi:hypothetical protein
MHFYSADKRIEKNMIASMSQLGMLGPSSGKSICTKGLVVSKLDSQSKGCGFESCLIQILDGNGLKAMPGSIPAPNSGSFVEK